MTKILFFIKLLLFTLPFYVVGFVLHYFFRFIPQNIHFVLSFVIAVTCIFLIYKGRSKYVVDEEVEFPALLQVSNYFYIFAGAILGFLFTTNLYKTTLIIDNGGEAPKIVNISKVGEYIVPSKGYVKVEVPISKIELKISSSIESLQLSSSNYWLYNIDSLNEYIISTISYSESISLYKNGEEGLEDNIPNDRRINYIKKKFFEADVDYTFEAPNSISVKKYERNNDIKKRVIYRIQPSNNTLNNP